MSKCSPFILSIVLFTVVTVIGGSANEAEAQTTIPATVTPVITATPTPTTTTTPTPEPTVTLEERITKLETDLVQLNETPGNFWDYLLIYLERFLSWPVVVILIVLVFKGHLKNILSKFSFQDFTIIKLGDQIELSRSEVDRIVLEREILKIGIDIAKSDDDFSPKEMAYLATRASTMSERIDSLTEDHKKVIIQEAISMVIADGQFKSVEYDAIRKKAKSFQISKTEVDNIIFQQCNFSDDFKPPSELQSRYEREKSTP